MKNPFALLINLGLIPLLFAIGCQSNTGQEPAPSVVEEPAAPSGWTGEFVSDGYTQRSEGYDWIGLIITEGKNGSLDITFRSRADKKKPTCTFDGNAWKFSDTSYYFQVNDQRIFLYLKDTGIRVEPEFEAGGNELYFYCSGGATLAGYYERVNGQLDRTQMDPTLFSRVLRLQDVGFNISALPTDNGTLVKLFPFGLSSDFQTREHEVDGSLVGAEVEDLDADGSPEVVLFITKNGPEKRGTIIAYSVNGKDRMEAITFPEDKADAAWTKGYGGMDEFTLVERYLARKFPVRGANVEGTGTEITGQVLYKLVNGPGGKQFEVDRYTEF